MEFFSPAGARCDPDPAISSALCLLSFPKWHKRYKILRKKLEFMGFLPNKPQPACFLCAAGAKEVAYEDEPGNDPRHI
jgi:hypothetical protein